MAVTPMFPLEVAMLPGEELPLRIFEPRYAALVADCLAAPVPEFGVVLIAAGREVGGGERRSDVGALARIVESTETGPGRYHLTCSVGQRIRVTNWLDDDPYPRAEIQPWDDEPGDGVEAVELIDIEERILALYERIASARGAQLPGRDALFGPERADVSTRLWDLASRLPIGQADRYSVLAAPSLSERLVALDEAVDTVTAMVEFQLKE
jgi:uncharacterized protein